MNLPEAFDPTDNQIQQFLKACEKNDYGMVDYFLYYFKVPFFEGYEKGNRMIKKLIKMDVRRRTFVKVMLGRHPRIQNLDNLGYIGKVAEYHTDDPYSKTKNFFMVLCRYQINGRSIKLDNYLVSKALIILTAERYNKKSKSAIRMFPYELLRMATQFF
jgi:hypothetical protein